MTRAHMDVQGAVRMAWSGCNLLSGLRFEPKLSGRGHHAELDGAVGSDAAFVGCSVEA